MPEGNKNEILKQLANNAGELNASIVKIKQTSVSDPGETLKAAKEVVRKILAGVYTAEMGDPGEMEADMMLTMLEEKSVVPQSISISVNSIHGIDASSSSSTLNAKTADYEDVLSGLKAYAQIVRWYFTEYLKTKIPSSIEPALKFESGSGAQGHNSGGEDNPKDYSIPDYAIELVRLEEENLNRFNRQNAEEIELIFDKLDIKDEVYKKMFFFVCEKLVKSKKPVSYTIVFNGILKQASALRNNPATRNFPNTEETIRTTFEHFIADLKEKHLLREIETSFDERLLAVLSTEHVAEQQEMNEYSKIATYLETQWEKSRNEITFPLPTVKQVESALKVDARKFCVEMKGYQEIEESHKLDSKKEMLILIPYTNSEGDYILATPEQYKTLSFVIAKKMYEYLKKIAANTMSSNSDAQVHRKINSSIAKNSGSDTLNLKTLLPSTPIKDIWSYRDPRLNVWTFVFKELSEDAGSTFQHNRPDDRCVMQSTSLMYKFILKHRDQQMKVMDANKFKEQILKMINSSDKTTRSALRQEYVKKYSGSDVESAGEKFSTLLTSFLDENSVQKKKENFVIAFPVTDRNGEEVDEVYIISSRLFQYFHSLLQTAKSDRTGVKSVAFVNKLTAVFETNAWGSDINEIVTSLDNDEKFAYYVETVIRQSFSEFFTIYAYFRAHPEVLVFLLKVRNEPAVYYFNQSNLKTICELLELSRMDILKQIKSKRNLDVLGRMLEFFSGFFSIFSKKMKPAHKLMKVVDNQLKGKESTRVLKEIAMEEEQKERRRKERELQTKLAKQNKSQPEANYSEKKESGSSKNPMMEKRAALREKIQDFRQQLLSENESEDEKQYLAGYLKNWTMNPEDDVYVIKSVLTRKEGSKGISWIASIKKDLESLTSLESYLDICADVADAVIKASGKKHIRRSDLTMYLALYILIALANNL